MNSSSEKILFVIGMQKSGTSLVNRMLMAQKFIENPFLPEGKFFWGDDPPFTPIHPPCGTVYQKHNGIHGHHMSNDDYEDNQKAILESKIATAEIKAPVLMNKNPYNTVRITWLKAVFPNCKILAVYRQPVSNIFSLLKKYNSNQNTNGLSEEAWWGIKPKNWQALLSENKILQCCNQWNGVNKEILNHMDKIDFLWEYSNICNHPTKHLKLVRDSFNLKSPLEEIDKLKNFDYEYKHGSQALSKNTELRKNDASFDLSNLNEIIEIPPFLPDEIELIQTQCNDIWKQLCCNNTG